MSNTQETAREIIYIEPPRYAPFWLRLIARLIDVAIIFGLHLLLYRIFPESLGLNSMALKFGYLFSPGWGDLGIILAYELVFLRLWGATPGKYITCMRVISIDEKLVPLKSQLLRMITLWICPVSAVLVNEPILLILPVVDLCWILFSAESQTWHDVVARSQVRMASDIEHDELTSLSPLKRMGVALGIWLVLAGLILLSQGIAHHQWQQSIQTALKHSHQQQLGTKSNLKIRVPRRWTTDANSDLSNCSGIRLAQLTSGELHLDITSYSKSSSPKELLIKSSEVLSTDILKKAANDQLLNQDARSPANRFWDKSSRNHSYRLLQHRFAGRFGYYVWIDAIPDGSRWIVARIWGTEDDFRFHGPEAQAILESITFSTR